MIVVVVVVSGSGSGNGSAPMCPYTPDCGERHTLLHASEWLLKMLDGNLRLVQPARSVCVCVCGCAGKAGNSPLLLSNQPCHYQLILCIPYSANKQTAAAAQAGNVSRCAMWCSLKSGARAFNPNVVLNAVA
jgi:hypothetical protein